MKTIPEIPLHQWRDELIADAKNFASEWADKSIRNPTLYPYAQEAGAWDEQFENWREAKSTQDRNVEQTGEIRVD